LIRPLHIFPFHISKMDCPMRTPTRAGVVAAASCAALFLAPVAHATGGDNGTVKIHDASTGEELLRNEPHVCTFYLDAFRFDGVQEVDWHIEAWAPAAGVKGETVTSGTLTLDADGHGRSADLSLPDGHYKLFWTFDGENGRAKQKVFWTECEDAGQGGGTAPAPSASVSPSGTPGATASPGVSAPAASSPAAGEAAASASPSAQGGASGDLAETGSGAPVGVLSGVAAALVAAGGYLLFRRRKAQQG
jgi:LPXTG-motif cell wall-anchored protein